jgi:hypothetical protein
LHQSLLREALAPPFGHAPDPAGQPAEEKHLCETRKTANDVAEAMGFKDTHGKLPDSEVAPLDQPDAAMTGFTAGKILRKCPDRIAAGTLQRINFLGEAIQARPRNGTRASTS